MTDLTPTLFPKLATIINGVTSSSKPAPQVNLYSIGTDLYLDMPVVVSVNSQVVTLNDFFPSDPTTLGWLAALGIFPIPGKIVTGGLGWPVGVAA